jgi:Tol biopolymer transport system component/tRNA A-37 threonylcarbamoyl transferase component Bud32
MIGQTIAQYNILEKLGEGGMGVVYKAQDTKLDRTVALKFLPERLNASAQDKARFVQEAKAASSLNHPNVCTIHDIQEVDGRMFIVMEFVDGQTLRAKRGTLSDKQAIDIGIQIADGLAAAHDKGIVHRDIKPENIMIRKDGIAQIMDFGLAKLRASGSAISRLTKEGSTVGTAGYMSPEQVQGQDSDHRSDIFSYGVLLYELITGQLPFKGVHETALAYEIVNVDPPPMSAIKPEIDPSLDAIVLECLEKDPRERTQSIAQVSLDLKRHRRESSKQKMSRITAARPVMAVSGQRQVQQAEAPAPARAGRTWIPWAVVALLALALGAVSFLHFEERAQELPTITASILPPKGYQFDATVGGHMAISPDGMTVAYVALDSAGKSALWIRPLSTTAARQLPETFGASFPFWSPDNQMIGFFAGGKLKKVSVSGTPPVTLCDAATGRGGTWNAEGAILFSPTFDLCGIMRVSAGGGVPAAVTHFDSSRNETNHRWPYFLPDGQHFLYTTQAKLRTADYVGSVRVASLDGSVDKLVLKISSNTAYNDGYLLYCYQNAVVAQRFDTKTLEISGDASPIVEKVEYSTDKSKGMFSVAGNGMIVYQVSSNLATRVSILGTTGEPIVQISDHLAYTYARFSHDGTKIAFDATDQITGTGDVWLYDIARGIGSRFTFDQANEYQPVWSMDDRRVVYCTDKTSSGDLMVKNASGSETPLMLRSSVNPKIATDWSPDGKYVLYYEFDPSTKEDLYLLPADSAAAAPVSYLKTEFGESNGRFSPDGRWIAYMSDESGRGEIYVRPFPSGSGKWQVSANGGDFPMWRGNGKQIVYGQPSGPLMAVDVDGKTDAFVVGSAHKLFDLARARVLDMTPDGTRFLAFTSTGALDTPPLTLVTRWNKDIRAH